MHRVRVGLIGLCSVFLLVMLAAAVFRITSDAPKAPGDQTSLNESTPTEPLAQLGVAPGNGLPDTNAAAPAASAPSVGKR